MADEPRRDVGDMGRVAVDIMVGEEDRREERDGNVRRVEGGDEGVDEWADVGPVVVFSESRRNSSHWLILREVSGNGVLRVWVLMQTRSLLARAI